MKKTLISTIFVLLSGFINSYSQTISNDTIINDSVIIDLNNKLQECRLSINELENDKQLLIQEKDSIDNLFQNITNQNDSILNTNIKLININNEIIILNDSLYAKNLNLQENLKSVIERYYNDSILWEEKREKIEKENFTLRQINDTLAQLNKDYRLQLTEKNNLLEEKIKILQQKEILFAEKEQLYKDAINSTTLDKAKVEGLVDAKNAQIEGKEKEINLLQKNINEKEASIEAKNQDLYKVIEEKQRYYLMSDTLRTKLVEAEKEILRREEELKYT